MVNQATPEEWNRLKVRVYEEVDALNEQVGGNHYKKHKIQPIEFITKNDLSYCEANVVKYICRWREKGGVEDLDKAIHYIEILKDIARES